MVYGYPGYWQVGTVRGAGAGRTGQSRDVCFALSLYEAAVRAGLTARRGNRTAYMRTDVRVRPRKAEVELDKLWEGIYNSTSDREEK